jgi:hypothetical protein
MTKHFLRAIFHELYFLFLCYFLFVGMKQQLMCCTFFLSLSFCPCRYFCFVQNPPDAATKKNSSKVTRVFIDMWGKLVATMEAKGALLRASDSDEDTLLTEIVEWLVEVSRCVTMAYPPFMMLREFTREPHFSRFSL